jgi:hypothetical protein
MASSTCIEDPIVILDVGGQIFRSKLRTLTSTSDSYFERALKGDWIESRSLKEDPNFSLFVDRDPQCFPFILSYLRSGKLYFTEEVSSIQLCQLADEARFYMLDGLNDLVNEELERRELKLKQERAREEADQATDPTEVYKSLQAHEVDSYLSRGYAFVGSYELPPMATCNNNFDGISYETSYTGSACSYCGTSMTMEKWLKHTHTSRPPRIVVKRSKQDDDKYKLAQSPFRRGSVRTNASLPPPAQRGGAGPVPVSPLPDRSREGTYTPLTPGQFTLDQSF